MIKILNLNLWRYNDFEIRLANLLSVIKEKSPDVIFLQEVQIDTTKSFLSQVEIIKEKLDDSLSYKYSLHSTIYAKDFQRGEKLEVPLQHGMAILSRFPIVNSFEYYLKKKDRESEPRSIICFDLEIEDEIHKFANIHFANNEDEAKGQLNEFLEFEKNRKEARIMVGDFNMFKLPNYLEKNIDYKLSTNFKNYMSYEKDGGTLDYALIPKNYTFQNLECLQEYLSDHKGLYLEIGD